jgi:hypothetical protein
MHFWNLIRLVITADLALAWIFLHSPWLGG